MPDDLLGTVRRLDPQDAPDVLQDDQAVRDVFPEEPRVFVKHNSIGLAMILWNHGEHDATVANVGVEDAFEAALVADLAVVHGADAIRDVHDLGQLEVGELFQEGTFYCLDLV